MASANDLPQHFEVAGVSMVMDRLYPHHLDLVDAIERRAHAYPWSRTHLAASLAAHECLGLYAQPDTDRKELIGYGVISLAADEAELLLLVLDRPWQGRSIGSAFLSRLLEGVKGRARIVFLEVRQSNLAAQAMYEKTGFNQVGVRPDYYRGSGRTEDALVYAVEIFD